MAIKILQAMDNGRQFRVQSDSGLVGIVPRELLDDELGDNADQSAREAWIRSNSGKIEAALTALHSGGHVAVPFDRVTLGEVL